MKIFLDTNVILDVLIKREPFYIDSAKALTLVNKKVMQGFISAITINNIYYILKKFKSKETAKNFIEEILSYLEVISLTKNILIRANRININDFEDAIQYCSAIDCECNFLVTRNCKDYPEIANKKSGSDIKIITPDAFIKLL